MTPTDPDLLNLARQATARAYVPYSGFAVGAALLLADGRVVTGCNVENASYGLTLCAEHNAVGQALSTRPDPGTPVRIRTAAVVGARSNPCHPCGACRQVLHEFGCGRVIVELDGAAHAINFADLLPHAFGPADLA